MYITFLLFISAQILTAGDKVGLVSSFDAKRAWNHVQKQVEFGPRPSGSVELQKTRDYLISELRSCGLKVREQIFTQETPREPIRFVNILVELPESFWSSFWPKKKTVILASHYDTKWFPQIRFVGANDGASSTGVLLEIARVVAQSKFHLANARLEFIFFDGEEAIVDYNSQDGLYGSRYFVQQLKAEASGEKITHIQAMILMDMIGDRDLSIQIPGGDPDLIKKILNAAESLQLRDSFRYIPSSMIDDHFPFFIEGVPAINLIDFDYGPGHSWWHTERDTLDKISPQSLKTVGQTVLRLLEAFDKK